MAKIKDVLEKGEKIIKDSGRWPISYAKGMMTTVNGKLYLTNKHLIFFPSKIQDIVTLVRKDFLGLKDSAQIPLKKIKSVEKGWNSLTIEADKKYKFKALRGSDEWVSAINKFKSKK